VQSVAYEVELHAVEVLDGKLEVAYPPWMSLVLRLEVPSEKSKRSTSATLRPRLAASSATPLPVAPPPITKKSKFSRSSRSMAAARFIAHILP